MAATASPAARVDRLREVALDPVRFARGLLGHDPWDMQEAILRSVAANRRTAVKACHASAKTFTAAEAVLWWVTRYADGVVVTTAPTWTQVERLLWGEVHKAMQGARVVYPQANQTELRLGPNRYAVGLSTDQGVRFQGWHGRVLIILDEAPGVRPDVWEAIEGIRAGGDVHVLALGNPTVSSGPFYDAFTTERSGWATFTIDAFDTPNLRGWPLARLLEATEAELDANPRPYLVTRRWVLEKYHEWGEQSPSWQSRVRGAFPDQGDDALLSLAWLEAAAKRTRAAAAEDEWEAGVDVAGPGEDETGLVVRQGQAIRYQQYWAKPDPRGEVLAALRPFGDRLKRIKVDTVGIGYYFAKHLEDNGFAGRVAHVNVGAAARQPEKFANLKAEAYWGLRDRAAAGDLAGLTDPLTISQLAGIRYRQTPRGQILIESKDEARKRGVKSPDRAETVMLAFHSSPKTEVF